MFSEKQFYIFPLFQATNTVLITSDTMFASDQNRLNVGVLLKDNAEANKEALYLYLYLS